MPPSDLLRDPDACEPSALPSGACSDPVPAYFPIRTGFNGIALVGEAPGREEARLGRPFVGKAGQVLDNLLSECGIARDQCLVVNTFSRRPVHNRISHFFCSARRSKSENIRIDTALGAHPSGYVRSEFSADLERLFLLLHTSGARVALALGATPLWALAHRRGVVENAGVPMADRSGLLTVIPTYHPAYLLRIRSPELFTATREHLLLAVTLSSTR